MFRGFRYRRGLTQAAFAELAGLPLQLVSEWETNKRPASPAALRDLATAFNVSVADLLHKPPKDVSLRYGGSAPRTGPKPMDWDAQAQAQYGRLPFQHFGYLRLQLTAADAPRWYPLSGEQAWWLRNEIDRRSGMEMVIAKTLNNRGLMFAVDQVFDASVLSTAQAVSRPDFELGWDKDGLPPEVYRLLRNWARNDLRAFFEVSSALHQRREDILSRPGLRRRTTMAALIDHSFVYRISDKPIALSADAANLTTAVRSLRLGMLTLYLSERVGTREYLVPIEDIRLIDLPALDLEDYRLFDFVVKPA